MTSARTTPAVDCRRQYCWRNSRNGLDSKARCSTNQSRKRVTNWARRTACFKDAARTICLSQSEIASTDNDRLDVLAHDVKLKSAQH